MHDLSLLQEKQYLVSNTLPELRLSLITIHKNTSCNQVLQKYLINGMFCKTR